MSFEPRLFSAGLPHDPEMLPFVAVAEDEEPSKDEDFGQVLPVMPLKNTILFPGVIIPITVGRD